MNKNILIIISIIINCIGLIGILYIGISYFFPDKRDYNCSDFISRVQVNMIAKMAGWPDKDPYHLSRGKRTIPCKSYHYKDDL